MLWPSLVQSEYQASVLQVGWASCIVGGSALFGQRLAGFAICYVPKTKVQGIVAAATVLTFVTALASLSPDRWANTIALGLIACVAVGYIENVAFSGVPQFALGAGDIGLATGVLGSNRALGGAIAQALYIYIYSNELAIHIPE